VRPTIQIVGGSLHGLDVDRQNWKSEVIGKVGNDGSSHGNELFSGLFLRTCPQFGCVEAW
jgi:hypothetical protein